MNINKTVTYFLIEKRLVKCIDEYKIWYGTRTLGFNDDLQKVVEIKEKLEKRNKNEELRYVIEEVEEI